MAGAWEIAASLGSAMGAAIAGIGVRTASKQGRKQITLSEETLREEIAAQAERATAERAERLRAAVRAQCLALTDLADQHVVSDIVTDYARAAGEYARALGGTGTTVADLVDSESLPMVLVAGWARSPLATGYAHRVDEVQLAALDLTGELGFVRGLARILDRVLFDLRTRLPELLGDPATAAAQAPVPLAATNTDDVRAALVPLARRLGGAPAATEMDKRVTALAAAVADVT